MNAILKFIIYAGIIFAMFALLSLFTITSFGQQVNDIALWLFNSILPWSGLLNVPAFLNFILELMAFEIIWWGYIIANKVIMILTGNNLHHAKQQQSRN